MSDHSTHPAAAVAVHADAVPGHQPTAEDAHHVANHLRLYRRIGYILGAATVFTVLLSYINLGSHAANIIAAMALASAKAAAVAAIFMHLKGEKATIWRFLIFTFFFFFCMFALTFFHEMNPIPGTLHSVR